MILFVPVRQNVLRLKHDKLPDESRNDIKLQAFAEERGILWLNTMEVFAAHEDPRSLFLGGHMNPDGHKVVAERLLNYLTDQGVLPQHSD